MNLAIKMFDHPDDFPRLIVSQEAIKRAIRVLAEQKRWVEALALIRSAYEGIAPEPVSLATAKSIYVKMFNEEPWERATQEVQEIWKEQRDA